MAIHYIYYHIDPISKQLLYIGVGSYGRAWESRNSQRSPEHALHLFNLQQQGFVPDDWVVIQERNLDKKSAHAKEYFLIGKLKPIFNSVMGPKSIKKLTKEEVLVLKQKVNNGESRKSIGRYFNIDPHTVSWILSGKSNYYNEVMNEL